MKIYQKQDPARSRRIIQKEASPQTITITQLMKRKKTVTYFSDLTSFGSSLGVTTPRSLSTILTSGGTNYRIIRTFTGEHPIYDGTIVNVVAGTFNINTASGVKTYTLHFTLTGYSSATSNTLATFDAYGYNNTNTITHLAAQNHP